MARMVKVVAALLLVAFVGHSQVYPPVPDITLSRSGGFQVATGDPGVCGTGFEYYNATLNSVRVCGPDNVFKNQGGAAIACVGIPGNTVAGFGVQCLASNSSVWICTNTGGCTLAADWAAVAGPGGGNITGSSLSANTLMKATGLASIGNSAVTDNGTTFAVSAGFSIDEASGVPTKVAGINSSNLGTGVPVVGWITNVVGQQASQPTINIAFAPGVGDYEIHYNVDQNVPCITGTNTATFTFGWTANGVRSFTTSPFTMTTSQTPGEFMAGVLPIHVASGNVTWSSTVSSCGVGTSSYDIHIWMIRVQ